MSKSYMSSTPDNHNAVKEDMRRVGCWIVMLIVFIAVFVFLAVMPIPWWSHLLITISGGKRGLSAVKKFVHDGYQPANPKCVTCHGSGVIPNTEDSELGLPALTCLCRLANLRLVDVPEGESPNVVILLTD